MGIRKRRRAGSSSSFNRATLVTREWTPERGLVEHEAPLETLADLLETCLRSDIRLPERMTLTGTDGDGRELSVSFSFASSATRRT
jgi:hypothetical protein